MIAEREDAPLATVNGRVPYTTIPAPEEGTPDWLEARRSLGCGGSDAAPIANLSRWGGACELYYEKLGSPRQVDPEREKLFRRAKRLEPFIAECYTEDTGRRVRSVNQIYISREHPYMIANLDRRVIGEPRGVELKTADKYTRDQWGEAPYGDTPTEYYLQCQHYMAVTGLSVFDLAVLIGGNDFRVYEIARDEESIDYLRIVEALFWQHVQTRRPPPIVTIEDAVRAYPQSRGVAIAADDRIASIAGAYRQAKAAEKAAKNDAKLLQVEIAAYLGEHDTLTVDDEPSVTWKTQITRRFDETEFKVDHPQLHAQYVRPKSSRVMRLKGMSDE